MFRSYCLLTGGSCPFYPIKEIPNLIFLAEPYSPQHERIQREHFVREGLTGYEVVVADEKDMNIVITCKICQLIQSVQYGIVDLTQQNLNVLIELGMLYGFNKPVILMMKKRSKWRFWEKKVLLEIPSMIRGIEFFSYSDPEEISSEVGKRIKNLIGLKDRSRDYLLETRRYLQSLLRSFELFLRVKNIYDVEGELIEFLIRGRDLIAVVNLGTDVGITKGMRFDFIRKDRLISPGQYLEEPIGVLEIAHPQRKFSQAIIAETDPQNKFWNDTFNKRRGNSLYPPKNVIRPFLPDEIKLLSENQISDLCNYLRSILLTAPLQLVGV